ncbi:MAG: hypothetical protein M3371_12085, partial [Acidobacteriota bacterium]|nr:hypothetical protein [Acidobacteriota bacterium]
YNDEDATEYFKVLGQGRKPPNRDPQNQPSEKPMSSPESNANEYEKMSKELGRLAFHSLFIIPHDCGLK